MSVRAGLLVLTGFAKLFSRGASYFARVGAFCPAPLSADLLPYGRPSTSAKPLIVIGLILLPVLLLPVCSRAAEDTGSAQAANDQYAKGNALFQQGKFAEAIVEYQKELTDFKDQPELCARAQMAIGKAYYEQHDVKDAYYALRKVIKNYPSFPVIAAWTQMYLADMYQKERMYPAAVAAYEEVLSKYSDQTNLCIQALFNISKAYQVRGKIAEALVALQRIVDGYPSYTRTVMDAMLARADICEENGYHDAAIAELSKLAENNPRDRHVQAIVKLQMAKYMGRQDPAHARQMAKELSENEVILGSPDLLYDLLTFQRNELGDAAWKETAKRYIEAVSKSGDAGRAAFAPLEIAYHFEGDVKKAAEMAAEFVEKYPTHDLAPEAAFIRGSSLSSSGDKDGALAAFDALVAAHSKSPDARIYVNMALEAAADILAGTGRTREAIQRLESVTADGTAGAAAKFDSIGRVYARAGNWKEAAKAFQREATVKDVPPDALYRALYNLGDAYHRIGNDASARKYMQRVVDGSPDSTWARDARGLLYVWDNY